MPVAIREVVTTVGLNLHTLSLTAVVVVWRHMPAISAVLKNCWHEDRRLVITDEIRNNLTSDE